jgi:hypothetical protein
MVIGLSGKIRSGKSRVAKIFKEVLEEDGKTCEVKSFASPIYEIVSKLYRTNIKEIQKDKRDNVPIYIHTRKSNSGLILSNYREILQTIGTTARDCGDENVWVNSLFGCENEKIMNEFTWATDYWIIDDVRFPNEAQRILDCNGKLIRINRSDADDNKHIIENSLNDWDKWDLVIENNQKTKKKRNKELTKTVKEFLGVQNENGN